MIIIAPAINRRDSFSKPDYSGLALAQPFMAGLIGDCAVTKK